MKLKLGTLLLALAVGASLFGQAPPAGTSQAPPAAPPPTPKSIPTGIQTLPAASARDSVGADEVVLTIGSEKLTRAQYEAVRQYLPPEYAAMPQQMGDRGFATSYAQLRGLGLLAERDKLNESVEFKSKLAFLQHLILAQMAATKLQTQSQAVTDDEIKAYYAAHQPDMQQGTLRGIFVSLNPPAKPGAKPGEAPNTRSDDEARARATELRNKILAGADFATVAKAESDHPATAEKGGDFGTVRKGQLPPNLDGAVFSLKPKQISEPLKESNGYYIFELQDFKTVTLDEATATIRNALQTEKFNKSMEGVRNLFPVVVNEKYFGAPPAAPAAAPAQPPAAAKPPATGAAPANPNATPPPPAVKKP